MTIETVAAEPRLSAVSGQSKDGRPLARHRAPAADLSPWIARMFYTAVDQPAGCTVTCSLLSDTAFVRLIVAGDWVGEAANGTIACSSGPLLFGPHSRAMPIRVTGPFATFGFALRPGALAALGNPWGEIATDEIRAIAPHGPWSGWRTPPAADALAPDDAMTWLETALRSWIASRNPETPDPLAAAFDSAAFADPGEGIARFAERMGVNHKRVQRMALRDFGMPPKLVMRRARVLDMASQLLGVADRSEAMAHSLRYYDQSHLIRDFRALTGMTPGDLTRAQHPILTLGLETRQARRLEAIGLLAEGQDAPWRSASVEQA